MDNYKRRKKGQHLTWNERLTIERMLLAKKPKKDIAEAIGCCLATVYNEVKRAKYVHTNSDLTEEVRYNPDEAQRKYREYLKQKGNSPKILKDEKLIKHISHMIVEEKYSPQAILFGIQSGTEKFDVEIKSVNTIYNAIDSGYIPQVTRTLLFGGRKKHRKKKVAVQKRLPKGTSIEKRSDEIAERSEFGHWEMDSVIGKSTNKKTLLVLTERKTRKEILIGLKSHTMEAVVKALNRLEKQYGGSFYKIFKSITVDNGSEFKDFEGMEKALRRVGKRTDIFYCHPHCPHERGSNEVQNKLVRRWFPKGADFDKILSPDKIQKAEEWINKYPRKLFSGKSSNALFDEELKKIDTAA